MALSLTQKMQEAGFRIIWDSYVDRVGTANKVTVVKDGKRTVRKARKYDEALALCAEKFGIKV